MSQKIGTNHGIAAMMNRLRDMDPAGTIMKKDSKGKWPADLESIEGIPLDQWKAYDKAQRAFTILCYDHDDAMADTPVPPDPPDPPPAQTYVKVAPRVAYKDGGSDARYCCENQPGVVRNASGEWTDESGATYDDNYLCKNGVRSDGSAADCPTGARNIDGRPYCSLPTQGDPTKNTGSWLI